MNGLLTEKQELHIDEIPRMCLKADATKEAMRVLAGAENGMSLYQSRTRYGWYMQDEPLREDMNPEGTIYTGAPSLATDKKATRAGCAQPCRRTTPAMADLLGGCEAKVCGCRAQTTPQSEANRR